MGYAQLTIEYKKQTPLAGVYLMETLVTTSETYPTELYKCLKVKKGSAGVEEELVDVVTESELTSLDELPASIRVFSSPYLSTMPGGTPQAHDIIRIQVMPDVWEYLYGASPGTVDYEVVTVIDPNTVVVDQDFPAFGRDLGFQVYRSTTLYVDVPDSGLANRDYSGLVGLYFRATSHGDSFSDYDAANNRYESLRANAQSLVDALNDTDFVGDTQETYA